MEILQLLCVTRTMNKGDPNYEHFTQHGSSRSVFSMHSSFHRNHTTVMRLGKMDRHVSNQHSYELRYRSRCQDDIFPRIELIPSFILSSDNTNCKNNIQLFHQLFDELSVHTDYH